MSRPSTPADDGSPFRAVASAASAGTFGVLLTRVGTGDRAAFAVIYDRIAPTLLRLARARGLPQADAELLVEQVLLEVWRSAPRYAQHRPPPAVWLVALVDEALRTRASRP